MSEHQSSLDDQIAAIGRAARTASRAMAAADTARKNQVLESLAALIERHRPDLLGACQVTFLGTVDGLPIMGFGYLGQGPDTVAYEQPQAWRRCDDSR